MDVKELMIGDWVLQNDTLHQNRPCQIAGIYDDVIVDVTGEKVPLHESHLKPITMHKIHLIKNGFTADENDEVFTFNDGYEIKMLYDDALVEYGVEPYFFLSIDFAEKSLQMPINYVHELQNAMKLFGIEKEIII